MQADYPLCGLLSFPPPSKGSVAQSISLVHCRAEALILILGGTEALLALCLPSEPWLGFSRSSCSIAWILQALGWAGWEGGRTGQAGHG